MTETPYGFRIVGPCNGERRLVNPVAAFAAYAECDHRASVEREAYLSAFTFGSDFADHLMRTGSTKGYAGRCGSPWLWWDIDRADDLDAALGDARRLCVHLGEHFGVDDDDLLVFYSGSKGFHVGLPTALWTPEPSADFHRIARHFAESAAASVGVVIDAGVYDQVRAFRAPNSRHPRTGRHKRHLSVDELLHLDAAGIVERAGTPAPFEIPTPTRRSDKAASAWATAVEQVRREAEAVGQRRAAGVTGNGAARLNRLTLDFIRQGAETGDRHRLLYSAARNLGEFQCPPALAHALLTEAALDSGLPPSEVRRQIECGLHDAAKGGAA